MPELPADPRQLLDPATLAPLIAARLAEPLETERMGSELQDRLLDATVRWAAARSEFYADRLATISASQEPFTVGRLPELVPVSRTDLDDTVTADGLDLAMSTYTSGTSGGRPLIVDRSVDEQRFLAELMRRLRDLAELPPRVTLGLATLYHGRQLQLPAPGPLLPVSLAGEVGLEQATALLARQVPLAGGRRGVTEIAGGLITVQLLAKFLEHRGLAHLATAVTSVRTSSYLLTNAVRARLTAFWGVAPEDRYSLAEIWAGATHCPDCDWYHFDPHVIVEVLGEDGAPMTDGRGRLALTSLIPFSRMTPLLRYLPGDLVDVQTGTCQRGSTAYRFLGRVDSALWLDGGGWLTAPDVVDHLEATPEVARPLLRGVPDAVRDIEGLPVFAFERDADGRACLVVELRTAPGDGEDVRRAELLRRLGRTEIDVRLVGPGEIRPDPKFRP